MLEESYYDFSHIGIDKTPAVWEEAMYTGSWGLMVVLTIALGMFILFLEPQSKDKWPLIGLGICAFPLLFMGIARWSYGRRLDRRQREHDLRKQNEATKT